MTSLDAHAYAVQASKDEYAQAAAISPSSASSTSDSVFSNGDARSSQSSAPSSVKGSPFTYDSSSDNDSSDAVSTVDSVSDQLGHDFSQANLGQGAPQVVAIRSDLRRHPRRTCARPDRPTLEHESATCKPIPALTRQCDRKEKFVEALVDTATEMIEVIWPLSKAQCSLTQGNKNILDLRKFVQEVLRRSKTSHSTLQVALFYLMLLIPFVPSDVPERPTDPAGCRALRCGRRMFLAALILASKYLQDRNYTMSAWAKISGLKKEEICFNELAFLKTVNYDLHVPEPRYKTWTELVYKFSVENQIRGGRSDMWRKLVPYLTADLSVAANADAILKCGVPAPLIATAETAGKAEQKPTSPLRLASSLFSGSPVNATSLAPPPPQFLEPKVTTPADRVRFPTSPKPSKLETPCLPPINFDCSPAASRSQPSESGRCSSMGMAMQRASGLSINRASVDGWPVPQRRALPCSRRSCLSTYTSASSPAYSQTSSQSSTPLASDPSAATFVGSSASACFEQSALSTPVSLPRESYLRASSSSVEPECDATASAARGLLDLRQGAASATGYSTPASMRSMTDGSSVSDADEIMTPKAVDANCRPTLRTAKKRERPSSSCELEGARLALATDMMQSPMSFTVDGEADSPLASKHAGLAGLVKHRGGVLVDYGSGIDSGLMRSRASHVRSLSGSQGGARKKARPAAMH